MPTIVLETQINAPVEICFDLIRDKRLHTETAAVTDGKIGLGQTVKFESRNFGIRQILTVKVVDFERPRLLVDEMIDGKFAAFKHIHEFRPNGSSTLMRDKLVWTSPFGILGKLVDKLLLERKLRRLVLGRNQRLKQLAESGV